VAPGAGVPSLDPALIDSLPASVSCGHRPIIALRAKARSVTVSAQANQTRDAPVPSVLSRNQ